MRGTPCGWLVIMSLLLGLILWKKYPLLYYLDASENLMFSQGIEGDQCNKIDEKLSSINFTQFILEYFSQI